MRSAFPVFWIVQAFFLFGLGFVSFLWPSLILGGYVADNPPVEVHRKPAFHEWVLDIQHVAPPGAEIKAFFAGGADDLRDIEPGLWVRKGPNAKPSRWRHIWAWVLRSERPPEAGTRPGVEAWLAASDQMPVPAPALLEFIASAPAQGDPVPLGEAGGEFRSWLLGVDQVRPRSWWLATDQIQMGAPFVFAMALFTVLGLMSPTIRRPLARIFFLGALFLTVALLWGHMGRGNFVVIAGVVVALTLVGSKVTSKPRQVFTWVTIVALGVWVVVLIVHLLPSKIAVAPKVYVSSAAAAMLLNAYYWLVGRREDKPQDDAGISQGRPPQLWTIWLLQFLVFFAIGLGALFFADGFLNLLTTPPNDHVGSALVDNQLRILGAWVLGVALLTFFSMGASQDWIWRGAAWIFCAVFLLFGLMTFLMIQWSDAYETRAYVFSLGMLLWVVPTYRCLKREDPWFAENVEDDAKGWFMCDLRPALPLVWSALLRGRRRVFTRGVGARGWLTIQVPEEGLPQHDMIADGVRWPATVRFSNRSTDDDAALDIRGCALTLVHGEDESPLDLAFATGAFAPMRDLRGFVASLRTGDRLSEAMQVDPVLHEGMVAGQRRAPASFACMTYYQQIVRHWFSADGERYLARFRLHPAEDASDADRGVPDTEDEERPWSRARRSDEARAPDYLRLELARRVAQSPITFLLQAQLHDPHPSDPVDWYDPSMEWEQAEHPWLTIGRLVLTQAMTEREAEGIRVNLDRHPSTLTVPLAPASSDPRALAASQMRVSRALGRLRLFRRPAKMARTPDVPVEDPE